MLQLRIVITRTASDKIKRHLKFIHHLVSAVAEFRSQSSLAKAFINANDRFMHSVLIIRT